jgi:hypothetical protein
MASSYDPKTQTWTTSASGVRQRLKGFRGSAFSQMLPLKPNAQGQYDTVTSVGRRRLRRHPRHLRRDRHLDAQHRQGRPGRRETFSSKTTGALNNPRWYSTGVSLPTGEVIAFSGATATRSSRPAPARRSPRGDVRPEDRRVDRAGQPEQGSDLPQHRHAADRRPRARRRPRPDHHRLRQEHRRAREEPRLLQPDRDPSFEIFSPPNLFYGERPVITAVEPSLDRGRTLEIATPDAADISSVTLVRNTAMTHLVDSDQRTVVLPVVRRTGGSVTVAVTDNAAVLPDGPYNLFVNKSTPRARRRRSGRQVFVGASRRPGRRRRAQQRRRRRAGDGSPGRPEGARADKGKKKGQQTARAATARLRPPSLPAPRRLRPVAPTSIPADLRSSSSPWSSRLPLAALACPR